MTAPVQPDDALPRHIFRAYDIRGVAGQDLTALGVQRIARAYATHMHRRYGVQRVIVARDGRLSSPELHAALLDGLRASGAHVLDIGLAPSPLLYFAAVTWGIDAGVSLTASHNPPQFNGLKLLERRGIPLPPEEIAALYDLARSGDFEPGVGACEQRDALPEYLDFLDRHCHLARPLRVLVDPGNGVATLTGPAALTRIGATVTGINLGLDGAFPAHVPDPQEAENMAQLIHAVRAQRPDFGIAWDGDGDRLGLVDEQGVRHDPDELLLFFARDFLSRHPGERVLVDVKVSQGVLEDIRAHGGVPLFGPSGHSLGKRRMRAEGIRFGGESSGHFFFGEECHGFDDAVYAACVIARVLAAGRAPLSHSFRDIPRYLTSPELRLPCPDDRKFAVAAAVAAHFRATRPVLDIDGARIEFDGGWALVRASNTGPLLSLRFEARDPTRYNAIRRAVLTALRDHGGLAVPDSTGALPS